MTLELVGRRQCTGKDLQCWPCWLQKWKEMQEQLLHLTNRHRLWREVCSSVTAHAAFFPLARASLRSHTRTPGHLPLEMPTRALPPRLQWGCNAGAGEAEPRAWKGTAAW